MTIHVYYVTSHHIGLKVAPGWKRSHDWPIQLIFYWKIQSLQHFQCKCHSVVKWRLRKLPKEIQNKEREPTYNISFIAVFSKNRDSERRLEKWRRTNRRRRKRRSYCFVAPPLLRRLFVPLLLPLFFFFFRNYLFPDLKKIEPCKP